MKLDSRLLVINGDHSRELASQLAAKTNINDLKVAGKTENSSGTLLEGGNGKSQIVATTAHGLEDDKYSGSKGEGQKATIVTFDSAGNMTGYKVGDVVKDEKLDIALVKVEGDVKADAFKLGLEGGSGKATFQNPLTARKDSGDVATTIKADGKNLIAENPNGKLNEGASGGGITKKVNGKEVLAGITQTREVSGGTIRAANLSDPLYKKSLDELLRKFGQNINAFA